MTSMLSQTAEYALRAVVHLAQVGGGPRTTSEIAGATKVPLGYLQKILRMLSRGGVLSAQRGVGGGFLLARQANEICVLDVLRAADAQLGRIERCPLGIEGHTSLCALHHLLDTQIAGVEHTFASTTIADLLASQSGVKPLCAARQAARTKLTVRSNSVA